MKKGLVSVIIPIYNGSKYIKGLIANFERQTFKNFELVFVIDGATDDSYEVLSEEKKKFFHLNIIIISQTNKGVSEARNTGIINSEGEFICFCDIDDLVSYNYLAVLYETLHNTGSDVAFCDFKCLDNFSGIDFHNDFGTKRVSVSSSDKILRDYLFQRMQSACCTFLYRRCLSQKYDLYYISEFKYGEDYNFIWRLLAYSEKIAHVECCLYYYLSHESSAMARFTCERLQVIKAIESLYPFFKKNNKDFYCLFKKYAKSRMLWALIWQAVFFLNYTEWIIFFQNYNIKKCMCDMLSYKGLRIKISAFLYLISPFLFYMTVKICIPKLLTFHNRISNNSN